MTRDAVVVRARNGILHRLHRGVYAVGHRELPAEGRYLAAVKACGASAVLSHLAAGCVWGFVQENPDVVDVTVAGPAARVHYGVRVHRSVDLTAQEVTRRAGIPITTPIRTLADLATMVDERELRRLVRRAQAVRKVRLRQLAALHRRRRGRRGNAKLGRIIALGAAPTRSELEDVVLDLLLEAGFEAPDVNRPLRFGDRVIVPDFRWPEQRLILEADGRAWHDDPLARADDAERQAFLEVHGERVVRATWEQVVGRPAETVARLRTAGAPVACRP
jgi:very-short-patch-repair endonuclease